MKTLELFNAVISKESKEKPFVSKDGFIIEPNALWAKDRIIDYYKKEKLNGNDLNKTFHKSWTKIKNSTRVELLIEQILHYLSTYGSNFQDEIYIPNEVLNVPDIKVVFKVIKAYTKEEMTDKCLSLLKSGIALKEKTINDLLSVLVEDLNYQFTGEEKIKNKEAVVKIADMYGVIPKDTLEFLRYILFRTTGESLLIKNKDSIKAIKESNYNPSIQFNQFGLEKLAEVFNRFKPLFLAYKSKCGKTINKISKLSKKYHKPLVFNPLNRVTNTLLQLTDVHWLDNATPFALFKALSACYTRVNGQDTFAYRIRNGKSWITDGKSDNSLNSQNFSFLMNYMKKRFNLNDKKIFVPEDIDYALPTSEKMFVGNIPTGTRFYGDRLAIGIYWKDSWGAYDLDLSGLNIDGKIGWNTVYNQDEGGLMYSGDITSAPKGAVEYLYAAKKFKQNTLIQNNVYDGDNQCDYKIIVGRGDRINKKYMMDPNNLFLEVKCKSVQRQTILGMLIPQKNKQCFVLLNFGAGNVRVSGGSAISMDATKALYQQWNNPLSFNELIKELGATLTDDPEKANFDFTLNKLEKDSFTKLFK